MKIVITIIIIITLMLVFWSGNYFYNLAINPKTSKGVVFKNNHKDEKKRKRKK